MIHDAEFKRTCSQLHLVTASVRIFAKLYSVLAKLLKQGPLQLDACLKFLNFRHLLFNRAIHIWQRAHLGSGVLQLVLELVRSTGHVLEGELLAAAAWPTGRSSCRDARRGLETGADLCEDNRQLGQSVEVVWGQSRREGERRQF
ncbi:hypothetical protein CCMA1212_000097 [Trichoderma ghanense]|uniref:Uncharacterized protein n=1 Tax=Trichoderma ghanense TaxID=65468 RepID=A0ABY2HF50_9HYPO